MLIRIALIFYIIISIPAFLFFFIKVFKKIYHLYFISINKNSFILAEENNKLIDNIKPLTEHRIIAHALGAIVDNDNIYTYTNSLDAFISNYKKGYRAFEVDITFSKDNELVLVHDWNSAISITKNNKFKLKLTHKEWKESKIYNKYSTMDINDLLNLLNVYNDIYFITDTKFTYIKETFNIFTKIKNLADKVNPLILNRIVPQIYNPKMLETIYSIYPFPNIIYTLYKNIQTINEIIDFVKIHPCIKIVTMRKNMATKDFVNNLNSIGKKVYIHTINNFNEVLDLSKNGIHGIYSDYLFY